MKDILQQIIATKHLEVERQKKAIPMETLLAMGGLRLEREPLSLRKALSSANLPIIAEFKRKSPSKGLINSAVNLSDVVNGYYKASAAACSILTDNTYFGGTFADLQQARQTVPRLPLLRKDFIIDEYQIFQARVFGADAILLIAACLEQKQCLQLAQTAHQLGLEVLLEIHTVEELDYLNPFVNLLGMNNRHLGSFHTDPERGLSIVDKMHARINQEYRENPPLLIAESGIDSPQTLSLLRQAGFQAFLIGEAFMKHTDPAAELAHFIHQLS